MGEQKTGSRFERGLFLCAVVAALLLLGTLARPLRTGRIPVVLDLGHFHLPLRTWYAQCLAQGWNFDWLPGMYNGVFITGEGEHGPYHPLHLLLYRILPVPRAFALEVFLPFPLMLLGMFLFLRRHTGAAAAMVGGLVYTFSGNHLYQGCQVNYLGILAHLPWLLWLIDGAALGVPSVRGRLSLVGIALLTGSQLLLGQPQAMSYSLFAEIVYCCALVTPMRRPLRVGLPLVSAKLLGLLIGAVQLLSTYEFLGHSTRTSMDPNIGSLPFSLFAQLLSPALMVLPLDGWFYGAFYLGMVPILLALYWLGAARIIRVPKLRLTLVPKLRLGTLFAKLRFASASDAGGGGAKRSFADGVPKQSLGTRYTRNDGEREELSRARLVGFAVVLGILSVWLAMGSHGGLYSWQLKLPLVQHFRAPGRYVNLLGLAAAVLSAVVFQRLQEGVQAGQSLAWRRLALPWLGVGATLVVALAFHRAYPHVEQRRLSSSFYAGPLLALAAAVALTLAARGRAIGLFALLVLVVGEIDYFSLRGPNVGEPLWRYCPTAAEWEARTSHPPTDGSGRVLALSMKTPSLCLMIQGERLVNGYRGGLEPGKKLDYLRVRPLRLSGAAWYCDHHHLLEQSPDLTTSDENWHAVPSPLPRLRLLGRAQVSDDPAADLEHIDIDTMALVSHPVDVESGEPGSAQLIHEEPGELRVHVEAPGRRLLVIADGYDPAWQVEVDGEPRYVERVNGDFLGCVIEPGAHAVRFAFRSASVYYGRRLSLIGFSFAVLIAGITLLASWMSRKKTPRDAGITKDTSSLSLAGPRRAAG